VNRVKEKKEKKRKRQIEAITVFLNLYKKDGICV